MMKKLPFLISGFAVLLLMTACSSTSTPVVTDTGTSQPTGMIAEGRLLPVNSLEQSFSAPGQVAEVLVADGETVTRDQELARLESSPEAQAVIARAEQEYLSAQQALDSLNEAAEVSLAQANLVLIEAQGALDEAQDRVDVEDTDENRALLANAAAALEQAQRTLTKLESGKGVDPNQLAAAEARLASAEASLSSAQAAVETLWLKAPLDGTVVDLDLQAGEQVAAGAPVLTIADTSSWVVKTDNLTEIEVVSVEIGQKVTVTLDALPEKPLSGEVTHINARYEEKRGDITYTVTIALSQVDPKMRWGMTAAVEFLP